MNTRNVIQASVIAALFAAGAAAQAAPFGNGDAEYTQPAQVHSTQSFRSAQAASLAGTPRNSMANEGEGNGAAVAAAGNSHLDRATVRAAALQAQRAGEINNGDAMSF
jgi:hypothetical protein